MYLWEISSKDTITQELIREMVKKSTVLEFAKFYPVTGNADSPRKAASASGGDFRALDNDYTGVTASPDFGTVNLKIFGDKIKVDIAHERRGQDVDSVRTLEMINFVQNMAKQFQYYFFKGDSNVDSKQFDGIAKLVDSGQVITAGTNGLEVVTGNDNTAKQAQQKFLELLDQLIESVDGGAEVIYMDSLVLSRLTSIAREYIRYEVNEFGKKIPLYNEVPIRSAGYDKDGNRVLSHDETVGSSTNCTSIYAVRFGARADVTIATNVGLEHKDLGVVENFYVDMIEMDVCPVVLNTKALARLKGIIIP